MPRSNKKKKVANIPSSAQSTGEPPPGSLTQTHDNQISLLFSEETAIMISRSIESASNLNMAHQIQEMETVPLKQLSKM